MKASLHQHHRGIGGRGGEGVLGRRGERGFCGHPLVEGRGGREGLRGVGPRGDGVAIARNDVRGGGYSTVRRVRGDGGGGKRGEGAVPRELSGGAAGGGREREGREERRESPLLKGHRAIGRL